MKLENKVVVITGAGSGIGKGFAERFAVEGASVVLADIDKDSVMSVASAVSGVGIRADMTLESDVQNVVKMAEDAYGPIDIWFSNAGISARRLPGVIPDNEEWQQMWSLHVMAHVYAARAVLPQMVERGSGYLLQTVSRVAIRSHPGKAAYSVTKHASLALGEWLAIHYRPLGVRISCFCPGAMNTPMLLRNERSLDDLVMKNALSPEQVAELLVKGIESEQFLILTPDADVQPLADRANDYEAWLDSRLA
jgi:NAD(P)-dependent dehydrogenase (short-subunit alcohol dehydrogenase family)